MIYEKQQYYISWEVLDMFHKKQTQYSWKQSNKCISFSQDINSQAVQDLVLNDVYSFTFGFYVSKYKSSSSSPANQEKELIEIQAPGFTCHSKRW